MAFLQSYVDVAAKLKGTILWHAYLFSDSEVHLFMKLPHAKDLEHHLKFQFIMHINMAIRSPRLNELVKNMKNAQKHSLLLYSQYSLIGSRELMY